MCIRDRVAVAQEQLGQVGVGGAAGVDAHAGPARRDDERGCLLYTSDAADERSSVDPGGRRIIKKKNSNTYSGTEITNTSVIHIDCTRGRKRQE